jgi:hypothetical protein
MKLIEINKDIKTKFINYLIEVNFEN